MQTPKPGDRIRLISMPDDPDPIKPGVTGIVTAVRPHDFGLWGRWTQIDVEWDNGRKLMLSVPPDRYIVILADAEKLEQP